jgi:hypothetical protein
MFNGKTTVVENFTRLSLYFSSPGTVGQTPEFIGSIANVTISQGRDASFACSVKNLGGFKVTVTEYSR